MKNKYYMTINHQLLSLTLAPAKKQGYCFRCSVKKVIKVISERPIGLSWEQREFCSTCSLANIEELEQGDYEIEDKQAVIRKLRKVLEKAEEI